MVDPENIAAAGVAVSAAVGATGLIRRAFGPPADAIGAYLAQRVELRSEQQIQNLRRIAERTQHKAGEAFGSGAVNPRVSARAILDGSYADDAVVVDYWSGLLASARSHDGRDDRAIWWSGRIANMSALQVRLHYLLYREWARRLRDSTAPISPGTANREPSMYLGVAELTAVLFEPDADIDHEAGLVHAITGLTADGLLANGRIYEPHADDGTFDGREGFDVVMDAYPTIGGMELYGWAQGFPGMTPKLFNQKAVAFDIDPPLPPLEHVFLPNLGNPFA